MELAYSDENAFITTQTLYSEENVTFLQQVKKQHKEKSQESFELIFATVNRMPLHSTHSRQLVREGWASSASRTEQRCSGLMLAGLSKNYHPWVYYTRRDPDDKRSSGTM